MKNYDLAYGTSSFQCYHDVLFAKQPKRNNFTLAAFTMAAFITFLVLLGLFMP